VGAIKGEEVGGSVGEAKGVARSGGST